VLGRATWLEAAAVSSGIAGSGWWPIFPGDDESVFNIRLFPQDEAWGDIWEICVIVSRPASPEDPCCPEVEPRTFLRGEVSDDSVRIQEFVLCYPWGLFKTFTPGKIGVLSYPEYDTAEMLDLHYGYLYLHIPDNEEWPEPRHEPHQQWAPDARIPIGRYSKISRVTRADRAQYELDAREARVLFEKPHGGKLYITPRNVRPMPPTILSARTRSCGWRGKFIRNVLLGPSWQLSSDLIVCQIGSL
jgi:hypothetical protein